MGVPRYRRNAPSVRQGTCRKHPAERAGAPVQPTRARGRPASWTKAGPWTRAVVPTSRTIPKLSKDSRFSEVLSGRRSRLPPDGLKSASTSGLSPFPLNVCPVSRPVAAMVSHCRQALARRYRRQRSLDRKNLPGFKFSLQQRHLGCAQLSYNFANLQAITGQRDFRAFWFSVSRRER